MRVFAISSASAGEMPLTFLGGLDISGQITILNRDRNLSDLCAESSKPGLSNRPPSPTPNRGRRGLRLKRGASQQSIC
jgi:hypothetical protein